MLTATLQDRAALYASGALSAPELEALEVIVAYHAEFRELVRAMERASTAALLAAATPSAPPAGLRGRILGSVGRHPGRPPLEGWVVTDAEGRFEWVNPVFTSMCGHSLEELRGRKPGQVLQGHKTDPAAVERLRQAIRARKPCRETLMNYHKDGSVYQADIRILPVLDDDAEPLWFVARERLLG
jgi:PAS domain S-box-containing protein